jgi:hypothetical protein
MRRILGLVVIALLFLCTNVSATTTETTSPGAIMLSGIDSNYVATVRVEVIGIFFWPAAASQVAIVRCNSVTGPKIFQSKPDSEVAQYMPLPGLKCKPVVVVAEGTYNASSYITIFKNY